jgi:hypothetical protein
MIFQMKGTGSTGVRRGIMDELIKAICDAAAAMDFEKVESLAQQAEAAGGSGADVAKMARAMAKPPAAGAPPATQPPAGPPAAMAKPEGQPVAMAASRDDVAAVRRDLYTFQVRTMIAASRDCFDANDEREHLAAADPSATERHIASMTRKLGAGTLAASRPGTEARPAKDPPAGGETHGLSVLEIQVAGQNGISLADYATAKKSNAEKSNQRKAVS